MLRPTSRRGPILHSQYYPGSLARKCIETVNGHMRLHWCLSYAEAFQPFKPHIYSHLPANDHLLRIAATPSAAQYRELRIRVNEAPFKPGSKKE